MKFEVIKSILISLLFPSIVLPSFIDDSTLAAATRYKPSQSSLLLIPAAISLSKLSTPYCLFFISNSSLPFL